MASELSQFIEKELKAQGVHDDEEQRLLSDLRVKPLAVETGVSHGGIKSWLGRYKTVLLVLVGVLVLVGAVVGAGSYYNGVVTTRDIKDAVDGAAKKMPPLDNVDEMAKEYEDDQEYDVEEYGDSEQQQKQEKKTDEKKTVSDDGSEKKEEDDTDTNTEKKKEAKEGKAGGKKRDEEYEEYDYTEDSPTPVKE